MYYSTNAHISNNIIVFVIAVFKQGTYLAIAAFAREIVTLAVFSVKNFMRIARSFITIAHAAFTCAVAVTDLEGLVVGFTIGYRDRVASAGHISLAFALLSIKTRIAGTYAAYRYAVTLALHGIRLISLFHKCVLKCRYKAYCKTANISQIIKPTN